MRRRLVHLVLLGLILPILWLNAVGHIADDDPPEKDARQYLTFAYNVHRYGVFSHEEERPGAKYAPSAYREPGYPLLLAAVLRTSAGLRDLSHAQLFEVENQHRLRPIKRAHAALLLLASLAALAATWVITGRPVLGYLALVITGLSGALAALVDNLYSENLIVFLFAAFSLSLAIAARKAAWTAFGAAGLLLAGLALTRAAFQYFWLPCLVYFAVLAVWSPALRRRIAVGGLVFLVCFLVPVCSWMARNAHHSGRFYLTERGGVILNIRAHMNMMTREEYFASFLYWSGWRYARNVLLERFFDEEATRRLEPGAEDGFVLQAKARRQELVDQYRDRAEADKALLKEAGASILRHPLRHLLVTLPVAHRGLYLERSAAVSLLSFALCCAGIVLCWVRRNGPGLGALLPAALSFAFHAFLTHNIPRYGVFLIPILWVGSAIAVSEMGRSLAGRFGLPATLRGSPSPGSAGRDSPASRASDAGRAGRASDPDRACL